MYEIQKIDGIITNCKSVLISVPRSYVPESIPG